MSDNELNIVFIFISPHLVEYALMRILDVHTLERTDFLDFVSLHKDESSKDRSYVRYF